MEKGFNDDELADIMNEIESLEQEFAKNEAQPSDDIPNMDEVANSVKALAESEADQSLLAEVAALPVEKIVPRVNPHDTDIDTHYETQPVVDLNAHRDSQKAVQHKRSNTASTAMNFSVEGNMKLDLSFLVSGKEIKLQISEAGFEIELEGGAKFSLPVHNESQGSKVA